MFRIKDKASAPSGDINTDKPVHPAAAVKRMPQLEMPRSYIRPPTAQAFKSVDLETSTGAGGRRLIVGQGIRLSGEITNCDLLIVEGSIQATLNETRVLEIAESGHFTNGKAVVERAKISGVYQGELTVRGRLTVHRTGRLSGSFHYGELEIERGGQISGHLSQLTNSQEKTNLIEPKNQLALFLPDKFEATVYLNNATKDSLDELQYASQRFLEFLGYTTESR